MTDERMPGEGRCRRGRGRPRMKRMSGVSFQMRRFSPFGAEHWCNEVITLLPEEMEAMRLVDLMDYDQESAAGIAGVSRRTLWRDLHSARKKVADALVNGKTIEISTEDNDSDLPSSKD
ncbi:MAG: DUF134 domain-containing protein [Methanomicrobium sp.]|nr:DUF134 domain-containing protein [Methanomicrobium sp.]